MINMPSIAGNHQCPLRAGGLCIFPLYQNIPGHVGSWNYESSTTSGQLCVPSRANCAVEYSNEMSSSVMSLIGLPIPGYYRTLTKWWFVYKHWRKHMAGSDCWQYRATEDIRIAHFCLVLILHLLSSIYCHGSPRYFSVLVRTCVDMKHINLLIEKSSL